MTRHIILTPLLLVSMTLFITAIGTPVTTDTKYEQRGHSILAEDKPKPKPDPKPEPSGGGCTVTSFDQVAKSKSCSAVTLSNIQVPAGETLDLTGYPSKAMITFAGTTTFGYKEFDGNLISLDGSVTVTGAEGHVLDFDGARWWDGQGLNGGKAKPVAFHINRVSGASITKLVLKNTPSRAFAASNANGLTVDGVKHDNSAGDKQAQNTDFFGIADSDGVTIQNSEIHNQDDCLAFNSGTNVRFLNNHCEGGHGISIANEGGGASVTGLHVEGCTVANSANGVRIKTTKGQEGKVSDIHFVNVKLSGITDYGIAILQNYDGRGPNGQANSKVQISDIEIKGVSGSVEGNAKPIFIACSPGTCSNFQMSGNDISGGQKATDCTNVPSGAQC